MVTCPEPRQAVFCHNCGRMTLFVRLRSSDIVNKILSTKRSINLLHTRNLDLSVLDPADQPNVFNTNIYINEVLAKQSYNQFKELKLIAKKHGFKYVWHRKGSFLVKWHDGERSHVFKSAADLSAIASAYTKSVTSQATNARCNSA